MAVVDRPAGQGLVAGRQAPGLGAEQVVAGEELGELARRRVGAVRIDVVQPDEGRLRPVVLAGPAEEAPVELGQRLLLAELAVDLEAARKTLVGGQHRVADEGRGAVAGRAQGLGDGRRLVGDAHLVGRHAVLAGRQAGQVRGHRRSGLGQERDHVRVVQRLGGEGIDAGRGLARVALEREVVGAQRVDRDEQDVPALGRRAAAAGSAQERQRGPLPDGSRGRAHGLRGRRRRGSPSGAASRASPRRRGPGSPGR